jgi:farnesyl diphosphate synthase
MASNLEQFEAYLLANLPKAPSFHPHYEQALADMLLAGGKRFRPKLLLSIVEAIEPLLVQNSYPVALGVEMLHTYSLIHDDLPTMDDADLRRGHPTLHVTYDEVTATLVGDALNSHSFYLIASAPLDARLRCDLVCELSLNGGANGMVLGQAIDCFFENSPLRQEQIDFLHTNKTAKLIAASLKMGAMIVGMSAKECDALYSWGIDLGVLFQIQDDIIDATQSSEVAGKPTGNDEEKNSYVTILGLEEALKQRDTKLAHLQEQLSSFDTRIATLLSEIVTKYFKG